MSFVSVSIPPTHHSNQGHVKPRSFLLSVVDFIDAIPPALLRALRFLFPRSLHLIILRLVLWLPELREDSPHLADDITRYIAGHNKAGQLTPRLSQSHGSLASSIGIRKVSFGIQTPIPSSISTSRRHDRVHSLSRFSDNTTSTSFNSDGPLLNPDVSTRPTNVSSALSTSSTSSILRQRQRYEQSSIVERRESVTTIAHSLPTPPDDHTGHVFRRNPAPHPQHSVDTLGHASPLGRRQATPTVDLNSGSTATNYDTSIQHYSPSRSRIQPLSIEDTPAEPTTPLRRESLRGKANGIWLHRAKHTRPRQVEWKDSVAADSGSSVVADNSSDVELALSGSPGQSPRNTMSSSAPFSPAPITPCSSHTPPASDLSIPPVKVTRLGCGLPKMLCFDRYSFVVGGLIGEGGFGRVISALLEGTNKWYAIKIICKRRQYGTSGPGRIGIFYERDVMRQADRYNLPFVNRLLASWDDSEHVYLVMPLYQRNLISWIRERELYTIECYDNILQVATVELIQSLEALWSTGYIHRDIKPDNIMQDRNGHLILCDFGLAIPITHPPSPLVGTLCYMAPEIQSSGPVRYTHKSDIWSMGVVLLEMHLRRSMSYFGSCIDCTDNEILQQVQHRTINFNAIHDDLARDLIRSMLQRDPERRCTLNEIKQHPCFGVKCWDSSRRQRMSDEDVSSPMRFPKAVELKSSCPPVYSSLNYESICQGLTEDAENTHMYSHISVRFLDQGVIPRF